MRTKRLERLIIEDIHPLTIINDRYGGVYSGGAYLAFKLEPWDVPKGVDGSDIECATFWDEDAKEYTIGKIAAGSLMLYLHETQKNALLHLA